MESERLLAGLQRFVHPLGVGLLVDFGKGAGVLPSSGGGHIHLI